MWEVLAPPTGDLFGSAQGSKENGSHHCYTVQVIFSAQAGPYTVRGVSVGGIYTTLQVPELDALLDVGAAPRSFCAAGRIFLSHGHADHLSGLHGLLGVRGMMRKPGPPRVFMPEEIVEPVQRSLAALSEIQRFELAIEPVGMAPGDEYALGGGLFVRAFRTHHRVPSLGYQFLRRVKKLRPEFADLPGPEIGRRRKRGEDLFDRVERLELAYATDTLPRVLETSPDVLKSRVLILECTFLDGRKSIEAARAGCHIHLDELLPMADRFENECLVLMHFSQIYSPREVRRVLRARLPPALHERVVAFLPENGGWPG